MTDPLARRQLGALETSAIGLGCMSMSNTYGAADPAESEAAALVDVAHQSSPQPRAADRITVLELVVGVDERSWVDGSFFD